MNVHSQDLRQRILNYALNHSIRQTAQIFQVSPDTVYRLKKLYFETGGIAPRPAQTSRSHAVSPEGALYLQVLVAETPDLTLAQLCELYQQAYGVRLGLTTLHNTLKRLKFTLKKNTL